MTPESFLDYGGFRLWNDLPVPITVVRVEGIHLDYGGLDCPLIPSGNLWNSSLWRLKRLF